MINRLLMLFVFMLIIDIINHFGIKAMTSRLRESYAYKSNLIAYWTITLAIILTFLVSLIVVGKPETDYEKYRYYFYLFGFWAIFYIPRIFFNASVVLQNLFFVIVWIFKSKTKYAVNRKKRKKFVIQKAGLGIAIIASLYVIYGIVYGKSDFRVNTINLQIEGLPKSFEGYKIAQFSDAHLGSFSNEADVRKGLLLLDLQDADIIVFTGDMVNNIADEFESYYTDFAKLQAIDGKYSILGNHDLNDYVKWKEFSLAQSNFKKLIDYQESAGFKVLQNENVVLRRANDSIVLIGVKNWGKPPFKQEGDLDKAMQGTKGFKTKILLSHDPSHWKAEVVEKTDIDLTLSGHTHGMQMGINLPWFKWSPVKYLYPNWLGLYSQGDQHLYVNPGFGFIGFPGRIGMNPEITVFILHSKPQN